MEFDFKNPDYEAVFKERAERLERIRNTPGMLAGLKEHYKENPADFLSHWCCTFDPRLAEIGLPTIIPFILFPRQVEFCDWVVECWRGREDGLAEKSRDMGVSWLCVGLAVWMWLFHPGTVVGFGSRKEEYVDKIGDPKSLFWKIRQLIDLLPPEFRPEGYVERVHAPHMRILNPENGSAIVGEAGDNIGRGNRVSIYYIDEAAFLERPEAIDAALSQTANCRIYVSTPNGAGNPFYRRRHARKANVFTFHWAQPLDACILTPTGWRLMGELAVGDPVIGADGTPTVVVGIYPQGDKEIYRVRLSDGAATECCADHLWSVIPYGNQRAERKHIRRVVALRDIMDDYVRRDTRGYKKHLYQVPITGAVQFAPQALPLDPYVLGCLLGDGSLPANSIRPVVLSTSDGEIARLMSARLPAGCRMSDVETGLNYRVVADNSHRGGIKGRGWHNPVNDAIRTLGLSGTQSHNKFVPDCYKLSSAAQRLDLLRGLMDTDGSVCKKHPGAAIFSTVSERLAEDVVFLAQTLGGIARIYRRKAARRPFPGGRECDCREAISVQVQLPDGMVPFLLTRKASAFRPATRYSVRRSIVAIEPVGVKPAQCIKVAADDGLYLTDDCIVTHNSQDPRKDEAWYEKQKATLDPVIVAQEIDIDYHASTTDAFIPGDLIAAAQRLGPADVEAIGGWIIGVDAAHYGDDESIVHCRRGRLNLKQVVRRKVDGPNLAWLVEAQADLLAKSGHPVAAIVIELDGPGASCHDQLRLGRYASRVVGLHTGARLDDGENYNVRAMLHRKAKEYLESPPVCLADCAELRTQGAAIKYRYQSGLLLMQSKKEYKKLNGGSPDRWDAFVLTFGADSEAGGMQRGYGGHAPASSAGY